jgi:CDP-4-dehydro-6-deoxyglucose reductase
MNPTSLAVLEGSFNAKVRSIEAVSTSVVKLRLAFPPKHPMKYQEGQFLSIELPDGEMRSYSMANAVADNGEIELHIRLYEYGKFSAMVREKLAAGDNLKVHGPFGNCIWPKALSVSEPIVLLATGTGIAPISALIEAATRSRCANPIWLYWGADNRADYYLLERFEALSRTYRNFQFFPVLNASDPNWDGERGFVQDVAARHHPDLSCAYVYACGAPRMVAAASALLTSQNGLAEDKFFADAFELSSTTAADTTAPDENISITVASTSGIGGNSERTVSLVANCGATLMTTLRNARLITGVCGGAKSCGTCRVVVDSLWFGRLKPADRVEKRLLLSLEQSGPLDRLACQIVLAPDLVNLKISIPV